MSKKGKKGKKKIAGLMLFLGWMIFILLAVVFYFYFFSDLDLRMFTKTKRRRRMHSRRTRPAFLTRQMQIWISIP